MKSITRHIMNVSEGYRITSTSLHSPNWQASRLPIPFPDKPQFDTLAQALQALAAEKAKVKASAKCCAVETLSDCSYTFKLVSTMQHLKG